MSARHNCGSRNCWVHLPRKQELLTSQKFHVSVGTEPHVISQIPAIVVRILIDHDLVGIPKPVTHEAEIGRGNAEEEAIESETLRTASREVKYVAWSEATCKASVLPGMIEMIGRVVAAGIMSDPLVVRVNVRSFWMPGLIRRKGSARLSGSLGGRLSGRSLCRSRGWFGGWFGSARGRGTMCRNVSGASRAISPFGWTLLPSLRKCGDQKHRCRCE